MVEFSAPTTPSLALPPSPVTLRKCSPIARAGRLVVDADLRDLRAGGQDRVDRDHRDAGRGRRFHRRHDAVGVDRHDDEPVDLVGDVGLDRVVLRRRVVVGVEDDQLGAELLGLLLGTLVHLGEEQRLLVDLHQGDGGLGGQRRERRQCQCAGGGKQAQGQEVVTTGQLGCPPMVAGPGGQGSRRDRPGNASALA